MTDDFERHSSAHTRGDVAPDDPEISLITAYLARELTPNQIVAVQERLEADIAFRRRVQPVIDSWIIPGSFRAGAERRAMALANGARPTGVALHSKRSWSMPRIAAVLAVALLPLFAVAQAVRYAAADPSAPGHDIARWMAEPFHRTAEPPASPAAAPAAAKTPVISDARPGSEAWKRVPLGNAKFGAAAPRPLGRVVARSSIPLGSAAQIVSLSDGRVLVGDPVRRLVLLFDSMLGNPKVVLESVDRADATGWRASEAPRGRGNSTDNSSAPPRLRGRGTDFLVAFRGDSALWFDATTETFAVIDPMGRITRTMPTPPLIAVTDYQPREAPFSWGGGLVYKVLPIGMGSLVTPNNRRPTLSEKWPTWHPPAVWTGPDTSFAVERDSLMVARMRFDTQTVDTLDMLAMGTGSCWVMRNGQMPSMCGDRSVPEPLRFVDDMVSTPDGYIVTLHAREYRLLWIAPNGERTSQKLSYPWRRISEETRSALIDSVRRITAAEMQSANLLKWLADSARLGRAPLNELRPLVPPRREPPQDLTRRAMFDETRLYYPDGSWLSLFPEYFPPVPPQNALQADADGNVWIQQTLPGSPDYAEWEVVSRTQGPIDRVRIPLTRTIAGFGKGGIVYLIAYDAGVARLEKVQIK